MLFTFMIVGIDGFLVYTIRKRIECDFYDTLLMSGATKFTFWMTHYIKDVLQLSIFGAVFSVIMKVFSVPPEGVT